MFFRFSAAAAAAIVMAGAASAATDEYSFMPKGGRDLFVEVLAACANCDDIANAVATQGNAEAWQKYFSGKQNRQKKPALSALSDKQVKVLVTYLGVNTPVPKANLPKDAKSANWTSVLPPDGRQLALEKCMGCHSLGVTVLNDADYRAWGMIMRKSDHVVIKMTDKEIETLKQYLTIIAPMPEDQVPKQLRESAGTY